MPPGFNISRDLFFLGNGWPDDGMGGESKPPRWSTAEIGDHGGRYLR